MSWQSLFKPVNVLIGGGNVLGFNENHVTFCAYGFRPLVFLLEPYEDSE